MVFTLLMSISQTAPVPPPVAQTTADCGHPVYATDMLVCGDPALRVLDDRLRLALAAAPVAISDSHLIEDQADWFRRSRRCAFRVDHRACVAAAYDERLTVVALIASQLRTSGQCRLTDGTTAEFAAIASGAVLVRDRRVIAVGRSATPVWRPFVRYARSKSRADFRGADGGLLAKCRIDKGETLR